MTNIQDNEIIAQALAGQEKARTHYWNTYDPFIDMRLGWRASVYRHLFHILPGKSILEIGAGDGRFTHALVRMTKEECPITAVVFDLESEAALKAMAKDYSVIKVIRVDTFPGQLEADAFDYVIAHHMLENETRNLFLLNLKQLIKPGGGVLLFEPNPWNPYFRVRRLIKKVLPFISRRPAEPIYLNRIQMFSIMSEIGFTQINCLPYDFYYKPVPSKYTGFFQQISLILENFPYVRNFAGSLCIWASTPQLKPMEQSYPDLAEHELFFGKVSFVVPCHNEEMNIPPLVNGLKQYFDRYIKEIVIVDDNSTDRTADVVTELSVSDERVRLVKRNPPNGVGRALRDGLKNATGDFVMLMDCDFQHSIPEIRDLFDQVARGADGALGSRFSRESVLINYAFTKIMANRCFHLLANFILGLRFRDVTNNFKLFRRNVLPSLTIEAPDFAANAETGLKPMLAGFNIVEVPMSWVNRSIDMGFSTFRVFKTGPNYFTVLLKIVWQRFKNRSRRGKGSEPGQAG